MDPMLNKAKVGFSSTIQVAQVLVYRSGCNLSAIEEVVMDLETLGAVNSVDELPQERSHQGKRSYPFSGVADLRSLTVDRGVR